MQILPDFMSNIHPLIIHFPIALLIIAVLADLAANLFKKYEWLQPAALSLYTLGALGTVAAYLSGKQAADIVDLPTPSYPVISEHADLALYTMLFFGIYAVIRLFLRWKSLDQKSLVSWGLFFIAAGGLFLVKATADHGGELVYRFGVGTSAASVQNTEENVQSTASGTKIETTDNGSWTFETGSDAALKFRQNFRLLKGSWDNLIVKNNQAPDGTPILEISTIGDQAFLLTFGPKLSNLQISARLNLDGFNGRFFLVHHVTGTDTYDFFVREKDKVRLGRKENGSVKIFDSGTYPEGSWLTLKAVSSSGHFRGYVDSDLVNHGHSSDLPAGESGIAIKGKGTIQLALIEVINLDEPETDSDEQNGSGHNESGHSH
ncbi:MAG TPA: DUF2231 domain-containing protein [Caldithrix abyssi]|uniref:DUF2231 domain-containing protein n=1 Tax=Caldithrix abyssi TaxID=187145 RepID=A0A7V4WVB1_CALAY|nr:DUF2231 domain-containing protein [Caldithrix abyssi]